MSLLRRRMMMAASKPSDSLPDYSTYRGVYIEDVDGYLYTEAEWDGSKTANGVAMLTDNCRFVMALQDAYNSCQWGSYDTLVNGITTTTSEVEAKTDYDGEVQTKNILNELGNGSSTDDAPAAYYCHSFTFPNGKNGYLGATGEWCAIYDNRVAIASALSKCGGLDFSDVYWTSTQYDADTSWCLIFYLSMYYAAYKYNEASVRAFTTLKSEDGKSPYAFSFNIEVAKGQNWTANAEQLVQINKMFAIVTKFIGMEGGELNQDNAPQEFDLRINGVRNFNFYYYKVSNESNVIDVFPWLSDGDGTWFGTVSFPWNNPVTNAFTLLAV